MPTVVLICASGPLAAELRASPLWRADVEHHVCAAADEAQRLMASLKPRLVIVDRDLPAAETLVRQLRTNHRCSIVVAAPGDMQMKELALLEAGANAILRHPPGPEWEEKLARLLEVPPRKDVRIHVDVRVEGLFGPEQVACRAVNLSRGGMLLECGSPLAIGEDVQFQIHLASSINISGTARVVRLAGGGRYGCEFGGLNDYDERRLDLYLRGQGVGGAG